MSSMLVKVSFGWIIHKFEPIQREEEATGHTVDHMQFSVLQSKVQLQPNLMFL